MLAIRFITAFLFLGLATLLNLPLVSAQESSPNNPDCPERTTGNCTLTFTINYWPGDGLFHMDAAVYDKNCHRMDKATYIYKATTLQGQLPKTIHMHNFTQTSDKIAVWFKYGDRLFEHKGDNCTHEPAHHKLICPSQFEC
ncbi:hypothetical protein KEM54_003691 [Ascosphaera aggregata]|nr:hypothetical protein KEM54_003691 [Ascosphaera aggregata]